MVNFLSQFHGYGRSVIDYHNDFIMQLVSVLLIFIFGYCFHYIINLRFKVHLLPLQKELRDFSLHFQGVETEKKMRTNFIAYHHNTIQDIVWTAIQEFPSNKCLGTRHRISESKYGDYQWINYSQFGRMIVDFGHGFRSLFPDLPNHTYIYMLTPNCMEAEISIFGLITQNFVVAPLYSSLGIDMIKDILNEAKPEVMIVHPSLFTRFLPVFLSITPKLRSIIILDSWINTPTSISSIKIYSFPEVLSNASYCLSQFVSEPNDEVYVLYTSGSTGKPKGVVLTNKSLLGSLRGILEFAPFLTNEERYLSFLPLAHSFETIIHMTGISIGAAFGYYHGNIKEIVEDFQVLKPTILCGVPRIFQLLIDNIKLKISQSNIFLQLTVQFSIYLQCLALIQNYRFSFLDKLIFKPIFDGIGGCVRYICVGGAPMNWETKEFLKIFFPSTLLEGYGQTETSGIITLKEIINPRDDSIGLPLTSYTYKIAKSKDLSSDNEIKQGELLLKGDNLMKGYLVNNHLINSRDQDGWYHTGDIVRVKQNSKMYLVDRTNNIIKLIQGEFIALENLESIYSNCDLVKQILIYANQYEHYPVALVVPDFLSNYFQQFNQNYTYKDICNDSNVKHHIIEELSKIAKLYQLKGYENIKNIFLISTVNDQGLGFTFDNNLLTPTFKLRRKEILSKYNSILQQLYDDLKKNKI